MNRITIVIMHHTDILKDAEKQSLNQCLNIFKNRDIIITCPQSVDENKFLNRKQENVTFRHLDNKLFSSKYEYNNMLLTNTFYENFKDYDFILIYQLDGYVFRDDLDYWTKYDYVGAPWCHLCYPELRHDAIENLKKLDCQKHTPHKVGNGGISLRRVSKFLQMFSESSSYHTGEDTFFNEYYNPSASRFQLKKPECTEAARFSLECHPRYTFEKTGYVPSFCHQMNQKDYRLFQQLKDLYENGMVK